MCPFAPDAAALAVCALGSSAAIANGVPYPTVQAAIDATPAGGTITVCPGTYSEDLVLDGGGKSLVSADSTEGTVILQRPLTVTDATLRGLTLGVDSNAGVNATGDVVLECVTSDRVQWLYIVDHQGGNGSLTFRHSTFRNHDANVLVTRLNTPIVVEDSMFSDNEISDREGAAISGSGSVTVRRSTFLRNHSEQEDVDGGAIAVKALLANGGDPAATVLVEDSLFEGNHVDEIGGAGGAVYTTGVGSVTVTGSTFRGNSAAEGGAALIVSGGELVVRESTFEGNLNGRDGVLGASPITLERVRFADNVTEQFRESQQVIGGAVFTSTHVDSLVGTHVVAQRNVGPDGALRLDDGSSFACTCCDFGTGTYDNSPVDLTQDGVQNDDLTIDFAL